MLFLRSTWIIYLSLFVVLTFFNGETYANPKQTPFSLKNFTFPKTMRLCNEKIPIERPQVKEMLEREFIIQVFNQAQVYLWLKRSTRYFPVLEALLKEKGLPDDLKYLPVAESSLLTYAHSSAAAKGPFQFIASTGRKYGLKINKHVDERLNFESAAKAAIIYLKKLKLTFGSWALAQAAYNCGEVRLAKEIKKQKIDDYYHLNLPLETERFIYRIASIKMIMENPELFGYDLPQNMRYAPIKADHLKVNISKYVLITTIAHQLKTDYKTIKELNPQMIARYLPLGKYKIALPPGTGKKFLSAYKSLKSNPPKKKKRTADYYKVLPGDTLSAISAKSNIPIKTLMKRNKLSSPKIRIGQILKLR